MPANMWEYFSIEIVGSSKLKNVVTSINVREE